MRTSIDSDGIRFSIRNGLYLPFMHKGRQIVIHQASWSFREKIWVDDELVVNQLGVRLVSTHVLDVEGDKVEVSFGYRKGMKEIFVEARVDGEIVHELTHKIAGKVSLWSILISLGLGGLVGLSIGYLVGSLFGGS